jgi:hypothetical protein
VAGLLFVSMLGAPSVRVLLDVLVFRREPRGRVIAAVITLIELGGPAGSASAGCCSRCGRRRPRCLPSRRR